MAEKEYIEREAAYQTLTEYYHHTTEGMHSALREAISRVPAADVRPVVLCKDCKNYIKRSGACAYLVVGMREDDFCYYGKKMEEI